MNCNYPNHKPIIKTMTDYTYQQLALGRVFYKSRGEPRAHVMLHWLMMGEAV